MGQFQILRAKKNARADDDDDHHDRGSRGKRRKTGPKGPPVKKPKREEKYKREKLQREEKRKRREEFERLRQQMKERLEGKAQQKGETPVEQPVSESAKSSPEAVPEPVPEPIVQPAEPIENGHAAEADSESDLDKQEKKEKKKAKKAKKDKKKSKTKSSADPAYDQNGKANEDVEMEDATSEKSEEPAAVPQVTANGAVNGTKSAANGTNVTDADSGSEKQEKKEKKKDKKEKKEKKDKKDKKDKKKSKTDGPAEQNETNGDVEMEDTPSESKSEEPAAVPKATANGNANGTKGANGTNGTTVQRNGASYSYQQTAALDAVSGSEISSFLEKQEVRILDPSNSGLRPILQFSQLPSSNLLSKKPFATFTSPTPIQSASWPFALSGCDVIGIAETGSGKTLAFALPCVEALASSPKPKHSKGGRTAHSRAVIVSPTRELAMQTHAAISSLAELVGLSAVCLYGGASKDDQRALLRRNSGADIIVATPGRLKDFISEGAVSLERVMFAVLDEADRMLDKGFEEDIKLILGGCPPREKRQTLMFTATWPTSVRGLAESFMVDPVKVTIGNRTRAGGDENGEGTDTVELQANSRIEQKVEVVDPRGKEQRLLELLREAQKGSAKNDRILVFCLYKKEAVRVEQSLERRGIKVASIHGDLRQEQRTRSLEAFKAGTTTVLVATDVAARGLDIPEVKLVINVTVCT